MQCAHRPTSVRPFWLFVIAWLAVASAAGCGSSSESKNVVGRDAGPDAMTAPISASADGSAPGTTVGLPEAGTPAMDANPPFDGDTDASAGLAAIHVTLSGSGAGSVNSEPAGIDCGAECDGEFSPETSVTLSATPDAGSEFAEWDGACAGQDNPCTIDVMGEESVTARFELVNPTLEVTISGDGSGRVVADAGDVDCPDVCAGDYAPGAVVTLTAMPDDSSDFAGWAGPCDDAELECTVTLDEAESVEAFFALKEHTLTLSQTGTGTGSVSVTTPADTSCTGECTFLHGTEVTIEAVPETGSTFLGWNGDACSGTDPTCTVVMDDSYAAEATFLLDEIGLVVTRVGSGTGSVTSEPAGIDCAPTCTSAFDYGTTVDLTAVPDDSSTFVDWSDCDSVDAAVCTVTIEQSREATVRFRLKRYALNVNVTGNGSGTVTSDPTGIDCGSSCSKQYNHGTTVTLTASPANGSRFAGWTNCPNAVGAVCTVEMVDAATVGAAFSLRRYSLSVSTNGNGSGSVSSSPAGISCGSDCGQQYNYGASVTLTASPSTGSSFSGWSGGCASTSGNTCTVNMTQARSVTATFTLKKYALSVSTSGNGSGSVSSSPAGISCGSDCGQQYNYGTSVTLTASPSAGSSFSGWSGGCASTSGNTCTVNMTQARSVTATFTLKSYPLSVTKSGQGSGTVTSSPAGINCGKDCGQSYLYGTTVGLTATPGARMRFVSWSGCSSSSGNSCTVKMLGSESVTAQFEPDQPPKVTITSPKDASSFFYDGYDDTLGLWYTDVTLTGTATDPEDGTLSGSSLRWTTNQTGIQNGNLGTGSSRTVRLYSNDCFGVTHTIRLTATDSAGNTASATITVTIYTVC